MTGELLFVSKSLKFLLEECQFEMSFKNWHCVPCSYTNDVMDLLP